MKNLPQGTGNIWVLRSDRTQRCAWMGNDQELMSVDLGIKAYATVYSAAFGDLYKIGDGVMSGKVRHHLRAIRRLESEKSTCKCKDVNNCAKCKAREKEIRERRRKIKNTTDHLVWLTAKLLSCVGSQGTVFFPVNLCGSFSKREFSGNQEEIRTCRFKRCLEQTKTFCTHTGGFVHECREDQTSSWCTQCIKYCGYLGASRIFHCANKHCGYIYGRDESAARSIMLFNLLKLAIETVPRAYTRYRGPHNEGEPDDTVMSTGSASQTAGLPTLRPPQPQEASTEREKKRRGSSDNLSR